MKEKNDTMAKRILENGEIKDKKKINKSRIAGMTLIALVVTIIVIIILATVGITIGLGSGGVIEKAEVSKDIVKLSEYGTTIKMITANEYTNKMSNEETGELKALVKDTLKTEEKWVKDVEDVAENKIKVITVEDYIIIAQIWDDGDLDIINAGKDNEEPYPVISIGQEVVDENTIKLKVIADVTTTDKTKGIDTVTFVNTGDAIKNYNAGDVLTFNVTESGKYTFEAVTNMGKTTRQSVVVKIKSSEADIQIASEPTTSRNTLKTGKLNGVDAGPIEVNIDYGYTKLLKQYKLGEDGTWTNVDSQNVKLKVTDNMTVYARYFDGESKEVKLTSYDVANVDNIAPNAFGITATSTSNSITVNASTIDTANKGAKVGISGVKEYLYRIFRNESWGEWQSSKQFTDLPEGEYKVQAKAIDKAGNETISSNVVTLECKLQRAEVTFDNNDGSDKKQTVSKVVGTELGELPTVSRKGYDFAGWYTDKTSGTKVTENTVVPETDVTYYARWTARNDTKYTVIHQQMNLDGTTYTTVDTEELKGKTDSKVTPDVKSYEGFTAPEKQEVTIKADGSTTVTYKYTRNKYTLTYNPNGGNVSPTSIKADYDAEITLPTPTRKYTVTYNTNGGSSVANSTVDYTFNGWYTKASEGEKRTYTKMPAYNETLYAQWASSGIALPTTNKAGYVLAGWYTDSALTSEVTLSDGKYIPTANITLYAKWEKVVITLNPMSFTYDGTEKKPETTVKVGSKTLEKDKDYTVEYKNNINVGTATVTITGKGSYNGVTATTTFKINEKRITIPAGKTLTYNGEEQTGVDSKAEYKLSGTIKATNAGTYSATATLTDTANTKWSDETTEAKTISWKINAKNLSGNVTVSDVEDKTYTGSAITPEVEVKDTARNTVLTKNTDYTISYKNNVNAGTATITITGQGNYTGTVEKTFKINGDANPIKVTNKTVYTGSTVDLSTLVSDAQGDVTFSIKTNGTTTASILSGSKLTAGAMSTTDDKDQTVVITAKAAGNGNYNPGNKDITITVQKYTATLSWTSTTPDSIIYGTTGKTATATVKVTEGTAGKVTYISGSTDVLEIDANTGALTTKKVGSSEITAKMARTSTVKEASIKKTITVEQNVNPITVTAKTLTYNGKDQELISVSNAQGTVYYSVGTELTSSNYKTAGSKTMPTRKDANVNGYVVYYYCEGNTNYSAKSGKVTTKINKANLTVTVDNKTMTYGGTAPTYTYTGSGYVNGETSSVLGGTASYTVKNSSGTTVTVGSTTAAGTYTITLSGLSSNNYNITYKTGTLTIGKANATNPTLTKVTAQYDGNAHSVIVSGGSGGTIYYRTSSDNTTWGDWTTTKPSRTEVGTTYVQAYVKGDTNHNDTSATTSVTIVINKNTLTIKHYLENANDTNYTLVATTTNTTLKNGQSITLANYKKTDIANGKTYKQGSTTEGGTAVTTATMGANTTIYLYYSRDTYVLTLNKGSYIATVTGAGTYKVGQSVKIDATLAANATGYTNSWVNWTSSDTSLVANTTTKNATIKMPAAAITLTANGKTTAKTVKVTFMRNLNSSDTTSDVQTFTYGVTGQKFSAKGWSKTGYTLLGWSHDSTATTSTYSVENPVAYSWINGKSPATTIYAVWQINNYTVTYNYLENEGTSATKETASVSYGGAIDLTPTATKTGYTFVGWNTNKDATTGLTSLNMGTSNVTLYAIYKKDIAVTFKYHNDQSKTINSTVYNKTTSANITAPEALGTPSGYTFRGWTEGESGNSAVKVSASKAVTLTQNKTYYASYQKEVTATFHYCNAKDNIYTYTYGTTTASGIQYLNYKGVKTESTITIPDVVKSNGNYFNVQYKGVSNKASTASSVSVTTANTTYYAYYQGTITYYYYNGTDHTSSTATKTIVLDGSKPVCTVDKVPTPGAYDEAEYKGWSISNTAITPRAPNGTSSAILYAYYQKTVTATFNYHNGTAKTSTTADATRIYISKSGGINTVNANITVPDAVKGNRTISSVVHTYRGVSTSDAANATVTTPTTANTTYYASYTYPIVISFNANGGTGTAPANISKTGYMNYEGTKLDIDATLPANTFTKSGYIFGGWNTKTDGTGTNYEASTTQKFKANVTLYAKWIKAYYQNTTSNTLYATLSDAVTNSATETQINVIGNVSAEKTTGKNASGKTLTLNLNGKTVTFSGTNYLENSGTLTIIGSGKISGKDTHTVYNKGTLNVSMTNETSYNNGTGGIIESKAVKNAAKAIQNNGTVNINSGVIANTASASDISTTSAPYIITNATPGVMNINGGVVRAISSDVVSQYGIWTSGTLNINGGTIEAVGTAVYSGANTAANVTITGGTIKSGGTKNTDGRVAINHSSTGKLEIKGTNKVVIYSKLSHGIYNYSTGICTINNANAIIEGITGIMNVNEGTININNGQIHGISYDGVYNKGNGTINITGGTIQAKNVGLINGNNGTIKMTGGTVNTTGTITTTDGTTVETNSGSHGLRTYEGNVTISGGTIVGNYNGIHCYKNDNATELGTITITGGKIQGVSQYGIYDNVGKIITLGTNDSNVSKITPEISGQNLIGVYRIADSDTAGGKFYFYDGIIKGKTAINGKVTGIPTGYGIETTTSNNVQSAILKKNATMTVSNASMIVQDGSSSTFTYTYDGDGAVTVKSSDTSIATCSVNTSTKTVTVNALKTSTKAVTITVNAGAGTNYNATSKTVQIGAIVVTGIPTSWTKNDVTVTATTTLSGHTIQTCKDGKTYTATSSQTFTANGTFYVKVLNGSGSAVGSKESIINKIDKSKPTFTSVEVKNVSASGYDVYIYGVSDAESGIKQVLFPTWTVTNGQDDIIWGNGTNEGNGTWHYRVNISDHNNEAGQYITHIYMYDNVENSDLTGIPTQTIKKPNPITATNKSMYTGASLDLSTAVRNAQGTVTYAIKTNGTTTASTLSGSRLTAGAMNTANDNNQTVVVTATAAGNDDYYSGKKDITITVQKNIPTLSWTSTTPNSIAYGTTGKSATVTASVTGGTKGAITYTSGTTGVLKINSSTGALTTAGVGSSVITASIARTATVKTGSTTKTISVSKATNPITVKANTLTYNGKAQNLVTTTNAQGAVYYSVGTALTSSNYTTAGSTTIPTQTAANESGYVVYYYCVGNGNYNAKNGNVIVKINKNNPIMTVSNASMIVQDGSSSTFTYTYDGDGAVTVKSSDTSIATCSVNTSTKTVTVNALKTSTKAVTITVNAGAGTNYNATSKTVQIGAIVVTGIPTSWTKNDVTVTATTTLSGHTIQTCKDGKTYTATSSQTFTANGTFYVKVLNSSGSAVGSKESVINKIDKSNPTFTGAEVKNVSVSGYDVYIYGVSDVGSGIKQVLFPTWTATNGQDDIIWGSGTNEGNGTWHYRVNISEHNNETGIYNTHIYVYDNVENTGAIAVPTQNIKKPNPITVTNKSMYTGASLDLSTAVTNAQGTVTYAIKTNGTTTASTLSGSRLTAGAMNTANDNNQTVVVTATAAGNDDYYSGKKDITITVQKNIPTLSWTSTTPNSIAYGTTGKSATVTASVTGGTKGAITYTSGTTGVLKINSSTGALTTAGVGSSVITASISRTATVKAAYIQKEIKVTKVNAQTVTAYVGGSNKTATITGTNMGALSISTAPNSTYATATISGTTLTVKPVAAGTTTLVVKEANGGATATITIKVLTTSVTAQTVYINKTTKNVTISGTNMGTLSISAAPNSTYATAKISGTTLSITGVAQGKTTLTVKEANGNKTATITIIVDTTAPTVGSITAQILASNALTVSVSGGADKGGSGITQYIVYNSSGTQQGAVSSTGATATIALKSNTGWHKNNYVVKVKDKAGNVSTGIGISYYTVSTKAGLQGLATAVNGGSDFSGRLVMQTENIDLGSTEWTPIGNSSKNNFAGSYNGTNKTISGLKITGSTGFAGLFGHVYGGSISNLTVASPNINVTGSNVGGIAGGFAGPSSPKTTTISSCKTTGGTIIGKESVGGIIGSAYGNITGCSSTSTVKSTGSDTGKQVGGIAGSCMGGGNYKIQNCTFTGSIQADNQSGGIAGTICDSVTISQCGVKATFTILNGKNYIGGIVGLGSGGVTIEKCYNRSTISTSSSPYIGGIIGYASNVTIKYSYNTGTIKAPVYAGGIVGGHEPNTTLAISYSYNAGSVTAVASSSTAYGISMKNNGSSATNTYSSADINSGLGTSMTKYSFKMIPGSNSTWNSNYFIDYTKVNGGYPRLSWEQTERPSHSPLCYTYISTAPKVETNKFTANSITYIFLPAGQTYTFYTSGTIRYYELSTTVKQQLTSGSTNTIKTTKSGYLVLAKGAYLGITTGSEKFKSLN